MGKVSQGEGASGRARGSQRLWPVGLLVQLPPAQPSGFTGSFGIVQPHVLHKWRLFWRVTEELEAKHKQGGRVKSPPRPRFQRLPEDQPTPVTRICGNKTQVVVVPVLHRHPGPQVQQPEQNISGRKGGGEIPTQHVDTVNIQHIISHSDSKNQGRKELNGSYSVVVVVNQVEKLAENLVKSQDRGGPCEGPGTRETGSEGRSLENGFSGWENLLALSETRVRVFLQKWGGGCGGVTRSRLGSIH